MRAWCIEMLPKLGKAAHTILREDLNPQRANLLNLTIEKHGIKPHNLWFPHQNKEEAALQ
jgi:hypothetical protein